MLNPDIHFMIFILLKISQMIKARLTTPGDGGIITLNNANVDYQIPFTSTDDNGFIVGSLSTSGNDVIVGKSTYLNLYASAEIEFNNNSTPCTITLAIKINNVVVKNSYMSFTVNDPLTLCVETFEKVNIADRVSVSISTTRGSPSLYVNKYRTSSCLVIQE